MCHGVCGIKFNVRVTCHVHGFRPCNPLLLGFSSVTPSRTTTTPLRFPRYRPLHASSRIHRAKGGLQSYPGTYR
jgi:hypothetical protein